MKIGSLLCERQSAGQFPFVESVSYAGYLIDWFCDFLGTLDSPQAIPEFPFSA
jgi:hypothetical protein